MAPVRSESAWSPGRWLPKASRTTLLALASLAILAFLHAPLLALVAFSFSTSRFSTSWHGPTLDWYHKALTNPQVLDALGNSLFVALASTAIATVLGTALALAMHRRRTSTGGPLQALVALPLLTPEIVLAASLLLLFSSLGLRLGLPTVVAAHVAFGLSYVVVVVQARLADFDRSLEDAAADLGAGPWRTLRHVTLPLAAPGIASAALLCLALSLDDYVVTSFVAGVGATTLPVKIYSMVRSGVSPEIHALATLLLAATTLLLWAARRIERGGSPVLPVALLALTLLSPFAAGAGGRSGGQQLNVYIWSGYIAPETVRRFEQRTGVRVALDVYDSNEALLAKLQAGNADYDVVCPSNYAIQVLVRQDLLAALDHSALPHLTEVEPRFLDQAYDPGNRFSVPYLWGSTGIGYRRSRVGAAEPTSWADLWDPRYRGRVQMLDDPRETLGAALRRLGHSYNTVAPAPLAQARDMLLAQRPLVRAYDSAAFDVALLAGDAWLAQAWSGQIAKARAEDQDVGWVVPHDGSSWFVDSLVIPRGAPHPDLAHRFLDYVMEAEVAAEICRTMGYSTPSRGGRALLPAEMRDDPVLFPPPDVMARLELIEDVGPATAAFDRLWTEVKGGSD